jgi:hypothetical protein
MQCFDALQFKSFLINNPDPKMYRFLKNCFLRCLDDLHFKCIFHIQSGSGFESGSEIKAKVGSGAGGKKIILDPQQWFLAKIR